MAVGLQGRGKTTLLSVLRNPSSPLPANVSTVGVVMAEWVVPPPAYVVKAKKGQVPPRVSEDTYMYCTHFICIIHVHVRVHVHVHVHTNGVIYILCIALYM